MIFTVNHTWLDQPPPPLAGHQMGSDQFDQRHKRPEHLWKTIFMKMKYKYETCENWENRDWSWRLDDKLSSCRSMYQFWVEIMMRMAIEWYIVQLDSLVVDRCLNFEFDEDGDWILHCQVGQLGYRVQLEVARLECCRWFSVAPNNQNIAKGTTDPRVDFIFPK